MAQFVVSSYQLQKWALAIRLAKEQSTDEHDRAHINRSMREIRDTLTKQGENLPFRIAEQETANPK